MEDFPDRETVKQKVLNFISAHVEGYFREYAEYAQGRPDFKSLYSTYLGLLAMAALGALCPAPASLSELITYCCVY